MVGVAIIGSDHPALRLHGHSGRRSRSSRGRPPSVQHVIGDDRRRPADVLKLVVNGARISLIIGLFTHGHRGPRRDDRRRDRRLLRRLGRQRPDAHRRRDASLPLLFVILVAARFFGSGDVMSIILIFGLLSLAGHRAPRARLFLSLREAGLRRGRAGGRRRGHADHLPAHPAERPQPDHRGGDPARWPATSCRGLRQLPRLRDQGDPRRAGATSSPMPRTYWVFGNWWWPFFPGIAIVLTVIAINFIGRRPARRPRPARRE